MILASSQVLLIQQPPFVDHCPKPAEHALHHAQHDQAGLPGRDNLWRKVWEKEQIAIFQLYSLETRAVKIKSAGGYGGKAKLQIGRGSVLLAETGTCLPSPASGLGQRRREGTSRERESMYTGQVWEPDLTARRQEGEIQRSGLPRALPHYASLMKHSLKGLGR